MNQIAIFGVALLIAYAAGVPVDEQTAGSSALNGVEFISANLSVTSVKSIFCPVDNGVFLTLDLCVFSCGNLCRLPLCHGYDTCTQLSSLNFQCHCKHSKLQSNDEAARTLINNNEGKAPKDFLSSLAKNEQNEEVISNH